LPGYTSSQGRASITGARPLFARGPRAYAIRPYIDNAVGARIASPS
jgi:hypothetical protein